MNILTSSQLTFQDLKDIYVLNLSPSYIVVECNADGFVKGNQTCPISFSMYAGTSQVSTQSSTIIGGMNGVSLKIVESSGSGSTVRDGAITFTIADGTDTALWKDKSIVLSVCSNDTEQMILEQNISIIKVMPGANGASAVAFQIICDKGDTFDENHIEDKVLSLYAFDGLNKITDASFSWYKEDAGNWNLINNENTSTIEVVRENVVNMQIFKCIMTYKNNNYESYYTVKDKTDIYSSGIKTINGNVLNNNNTSIIAYVTIYKNGSEISPLKYPIWTELSSPTRDGIYYRVNHETVPKKIVLSEYKNRIWNIVSDTQEYMYKWGLIQNTNQTKTLELTSRVILLDSSHIEKSATVECIVSEYDEEKSTENELTRCQLSVIDLNEPIISSSEPRSPLQGQLWVDTSNSKTIMRIYNNGVWKAVDSVSDRNIFVRKPYMPLEDGNLYRTGDIWIVGKDYQPVFNGGYQYAEGTMLISRTSSVIFKDEDWLDMQNTDIRNTLEEYEQVMKVFDDGLYMFGVSKANSTARFYSQMQSDELAFYQRDNLEKVPDTKDELKKNEGTKMVWIGGKGFHGRNATIEGPLKIIDSTDENNRANAEFNFADIFKITKEPNGTVSFG